MIVGIGVDLVSMARIASVYGKHGEHFSRRILTAKEQEQCAGYEGTRRAEYLAGRFAVKEAVAKALGTGLGEVLGWQDIETVHASYGKLEVRLSQEGVERLKSRLQDTLQGGGLQGGSHETGVTQPERVKIHLSLSHEAQLVVAQAVVEVV